jgi:hypothetical protein
MHRKTLFIISFIMLSLPFFQSCSTGTINRKGFLPPVKISIPNEVKNDTATVSFIHSSEKIINEFSDRMEDIASNNQDLLKKKQEDMSVMDKIKMARVSVQFLAVGGSMANELVKIQQYVDRKQKEGVSENDMKAYKEVEKVVEKRINDLNNKYKNLIINQ